MSEKLHWGFTAAYLRVTGRRLFIVENKIFQYFTIFIYISINVYNDVIP